ncbi:hypothetical protein [Actinomadura sp. NPDC000600]|uniref:5'-methylthioadenosine/S-adenosylhomocysteine nucleosidase family protein n=1 Tax=Actinomadura sp. NPDC000600 TaxID=3154262 RepID=UPI00339219CF
MDGEYRAGLIIPLQEEYEAVEQVLVRLGDFKVDGHYYYRFQVPGTDIKIVAMISFDMGLPSTAVAAQRLFGDFGVPLLAVVGIAGILDDNLRYGDVVVASEIQSYLNAGKAVPSADGSGFEFVSAPTGWRPSAEIVEFVRNFRNRDADRARHRAWRDEARRRMLDDGADPGGSGPDYVVGPLASGDFVSAAEQFKSFLLARNRKYAAVEMEAAGAALAAYRQDGTDLLVVRGMSDHADPRKGEQDRRRGRDGTPNVWRRHAARNAAELLAALLGSPEFPWRQRPVVKEQTPPSETRKTSLLVVPLGLAPPVPGTGPGDDDRAASSGASSGADSEVDHQAEAARIGHHLPHVYDDLNLDDGRDGGDDDGDDDGA